MKAITPDDVERFTHDVITGTNGREKTKPRGLPVARGVRGVTPLISRGRFRVLGLMHQILLSRPSQSGARHQTLGTIALERHH